MDKRCFLFDKRGSPEQSDPLWHMPEGIQEEWVITKRKIIIFRMLGKIIHFQVEVFRLHLHKLSKLPYQ